MGQVPSSLSPGSLRILCTDTGLSEEQIQFLYNRFVQLDRDRNGTLSFDDLICIPPLAMNPMAHKFIQVMIKRYSTAPVSWMIGSEEMDFKGFLHMMSVFLLDDWTQKTRVVFEIIDRKQDNFIDLEEVQEMVTVMTGLRSQEIEIVAKEWFSLMDTDEDGVLGFEDFSKVKEEEDLLPKVLS